MKELYFLPETIHQNSLKMLQKIRSCPNHRTITLNPNRSALLILDMQQYFLRESSHAYISSAPAIIPGIRDLIKAYATWDMPIIFTQHINSPQNAKMMGKWWKDLIREKNPLSEITDEFDTTSGIIIKKSQYDAFYETPLENILQKKKITQLVISGVMTNLCCETTARSCFCSVLFGWLKGPSQLFPDTTSEGQSPFMQEIHIRCPSCDKGRMHGFLGEQISCDVCGYRIRIRT